MAGDKTIRVRNVKTDEWMELSLEDLDGSGAELLYGILTPIMAKTGDETFQSPISLHKIDTAH